MKKVIKTVNKTDGIFLLGAQTTIMSSRCAERCNIMRLVDTRWAGIAKGVGVQRIIGRIHMVQIQIENVYLTTSFSVLEEQPMDMLLGSYQLTFIYTNKSLIDSLCKTCANVKN